MEQAEQGWGCSEEVRTTCLRSGYHQHSCPSPYPGANKPHTSSVHLESEMPSAGRNCPDSLWGLPITREFSASIRFRVSYHLEKGKGARAYRLKADGCHSRLSPLRRDVFRLRVNFRRQEDHKFKTILGNIVRPYPKQEEERKEEERMRAWQS